MSADECSRMLIRIALLVGADILICIRDWNIWNGLNCWTNMKDNCLTFCWSLASAIANTNHLNQMYLDDKNFLYRE